MPHLTLTPSFGRGITRCRLFLAQRNAAAADRARDVISMAVRRLEANPAVGRPYRKDPALRELVIPFGKADYLALYRHDPDKDAVVLLGFRHQREADYGD